ncbi:MAG: histone deacetylase [Acidobacteria bacterium]|nr:histone deacetylase [Acidobacteriota bacterium]
MKVVYSSRYHVDIGAHVFRMGKYALVRDELIARRFLQPSDILEPVAATDDELGLVHSAEYLEKTRTGAFRPSELALLELPWSPDIAEGFRLMAGGTILAARQACADGRSLAAPPPGAASRHPWPLAASANLGGGFHHAFPSHGEGFCLYNDVAIAIRVLLRDKTIRRAAVVDVDVHQGNGTAFCFDGDADVFTFSIHQENNYPHVKPSGSLDVGLRDGADDHDYLCALERAVPSVIASRPDLIVYVAGADPFVDDQLGGLDLTFEGLRGRDYLVLSAARDARIPVVIVFAGGYARRADDTAAIHLATIEEALRLGA